MLGSACARQQPQYAPPAAPEPELVAVQVRSAPAIGVREAPPPTFSDPERLLKIEAALPAVHEAVLRVFEADQLIGLAVGVVVDGELVFAEGLGDRHAVEGGAVDARTAFRIGSITKVFTALTALRLAEAGKLDLDAPASSLLPEFAAFVYPTGDARPVTVRDILSHTSGLPRDPDVPRATHEDAYPRDELMQAIEGVSLARAPGLDYEYSNLGFVLLGHLIARVDGRPYADVARDAILAPLGMTSTTLDWSELEPERLALGHVVGDGKVYVRPPTSHGALASAGGLFSTVEDLARFVAFHLDAWPPRGGDESGPLLRATRREAQRMRSFRSFTARTRPVELAEDGVEGGVAGGGLGWQVAHKCEHSYVVGHNGAVDGYHATIRLLPNAGVGIIVLANAGWANTGTVTDEIQRVLDAAGGLKSRAPQALPELTLAAQQVTDLLSDWDEQVFAPLSTHVLRAGSNPARLGERMRWLHDALGDCMLGPPRRATSPWSGVFPLNCQLGQAELTLTVTTANAPKVSSLELRWLHGTPTPEVQAAAAGVVALFAEFDPAKYHALFSPAFARTTAERLAAAVRFEHGNCKLGKPLAVAGADQATFALSCDRSDARMTVDLDRDTPPRITLVRVAPAGGAPPCR